MGTVPRFKMSVPFFTCHVNGPSCDTMERGQFYKRLKRVKYQTSHPSQGSLEGAGNDNDNDPLRKVY